MPIFHSNLNLCLLVNPPLFSNQVKLLLGNPHVTTLLNQSNPARHPGSTMTSST